MNYVTEDKRVFESDKVKTFTPNKLEIAPCDHKKDFLKVTDSNELDDYLDFNRLICIKKENDIIL